MTITYLKKASPKAVSEDEETTALVSGMLKEIEAGGEDIVARYSQQLDGWSPESFVVSAQQIERAGSQLSARTREDIEFALSQVRSFALAQRGTLHDLELELSPGLVAGHRHIPVGVAGCYVPGGRYSHAASAAMSIGTAKAAGVPFVVACSPPRGEGGIHPATLYAMAHAGADVILALGGVQAIAAMAFGLYTGKPADVLAGPGNRFVAEAKRLLFGRVGIDVFAGPTEALIIADDTADPWLVAVDLASQAEHGPDSPTVLVTTSRRVAEAVIELMPTAIDPLPTAAAAATAWRECGEVILCDSREEAAQVSDDIASEHVEVHAADLDWWPHPPQLRHALPRRRDIGLLRRQVRRTKPHPAHQGSGRVHGRPVGGQVHQDADLREHDPRSKPGHRPGRCPDLTRRRDGGSCQSRRRQVAEVLPQRAVRSHSGRLTRPRASSTLDVGAVTLRRRS